AEQAAIGQTNKVLQTAEIVAVEDGRITIKNTGTHPIKASDVAVFIDGNLLPIDNTIGNVEPGRTRTFTIDLSDTEKENYDDVRTVEVTVPGNKATKTTKVYVFDPNIRLTPNPGSLSGIAEGNDAVYQIRVESRNGFQGNADLTVQNCPVVASNCELSVSSVDLGLGESEDIMLTVHTEGLPPANAITIQGTYGTPTQTAQAVLDLGVATHDFGIDITPAVQTTEQTVTAVYEVKITPQNNLGHSSHIVALSIAGCPPSATCVFDSNNLPASGAGPYITYLRVTPSIPTAAEDYAMSVTGTYAAVTHEKSASLMVNEAPRLVFITSGLFGGDMDGLTGDQLCQNAADAPLALPVFHGKNWVAWLSTSSEDAINRIDWESSTVYKKVVKNPDSSLTQVLAVNGKNDIENDGTITSMIDRDETGNYNAVESFTGTHNNGLRTAYNCNGWASDDNADLATLSGIAGGTASWSDFGTAFTCDNIASLYCFEVRTP
ncbi:MAG: hypothetical protein HY364_00005, partial [Candidatus Aenigmarchaeota archaeon]|nr:hypothetical protein [Candidatus Aenigmarchaeota archaeon]